MKSVLVLSKYLLNKYSDLPPLKLQKVLFFLRVEEKLAKKEANSFFKNSNNFQAWAYGPINPESFEYTSLLLSDPDEDKNFSITSEQINQIEEQYGKWIEKYVKMTATELLIKSKKNVAYNKIRQNLSTTDTCYKYLPEDKTFTQFNK